MGTREVVYGTIALAIFGWMFFSAVEQDVQRIEELETIIPDAFCADAAKLVGSDIMSEPQYFAYGCGVQTYSEHGFPKYDFDKIGLLMKMMRDYPFMTEIHCWELATIYLANEMELPDYVSVGCDPSRIPPDVVYLNWRSQGSIRP